ncbi:MAG: ADP-ribosylation factor-like protein [Candidatus Odinarchaeota archaeon]
MSLARLSIASKGGLEVFAYESEKFHETLIDPQILSGLMDAFQRVSEELSNPIQQIQFSNMILYVRTYGDFTIRLLLYKKLDDEEIKRYFDKLSKETLLLIGNCEKGNVPTEKDFLRILRPIIVPLIQDPLGEVRERINPKEETTARIALVGLSKAGKTTIKNIFFDKWSIEMAKDVIPTVGLSFSHYSQEYIQQKLVVMDFGGQQTYQKSYLASEDSWKNIASLIFVIDVQDASLFRDASNYLTKVWNIVTRVNEVKPRLSIFLHKYDTDKRKYLEDNIKNCFAFLNEFTNVATFHLTTINDDSSYVAMIKTLYFSLPAIIIKRLFEEEFIDHFEKEVLTEFSASVQNEGFQDVFQMLKDNFHKSAVILGRSYGLSFQKVWLQYLIGEPAPKQRPLSSTSLYVIQKGQSLYLTVPNSVATGFPEEVTVTLLGGFLEGILQTLNLGIPEIIKQNRFVTTWKIDLATIPSISE